MSAGKVRHVREERVDRESLRPRGAHWLPGQRWSLARKREVALRLLRGEPLEALLREFGVEVSRLVRWKGKALAGLDAGLKDRGGDLLQSQLDAAMRRIGELSMENELLQACFKAQDDGL